MKKNFILLLNILLLASCNQVVTTSNSSSDQIDSSSNSDTTLPSDSSTPSSTPSNSSIPSSTPSNSSTPSSTSSSTNSNSSTGEDQETTKDKNILNYLGSDNDVYRINIQTNNNEFPVDKENYIRGNLNITEQQTSKVLLENQTMRIKLRGNSTMSADKKPFKIKFDEKQSLFGLTKAKEWVLLANYYDKSNIRNYLAYLTANKLNNLDFQPSSIFVDVYFNNEYYGVFLLCEQMEAKKGRVDIEDHVSKDGISSFFLEIDERAKEEYDGFAGKCYVSIGRDDFALKYPDADDYVDAFNILEDENSSIEDINSANETMSAFDKNNQWLESFLMNVNNSVYSSETYSDFIDVDSFIDYYLVEEFFKNVDVCSTSQYYFIDQNDSVVKLKAGPVWDFDIASGTVSYDSPGIDTYAQYVYTPLFVRQRDTLYNALFNIPEFEQKVRQRYSEVREDVFLSVFNEIDILKDKLNKAQNRNIQKWPFTTERKTWVEQYALSQSYLEFDSINSHYEYLENYLHERLDLLDEYYLIK